MKTNPKNLIQMYPGIKIRLQNVKQICYDELV